MSDPHAPCPPRGVPPVPLPPAPPAGDDGIRWELVHRMRRLIAEGKLDTPERWAVAEELLFRAVDDRR